jgi:hypothetical protein
VTLSHPFSPTITYLPDAGSSDASETHGRYAKRWPGG